MDKEDKVNPMAHCIVSVAETETAVIITLRGLPWNARRRWADALKYVRGLWYRADLHSRSYSLPIHTVYLLGALEREDRRIAFSRRRFFSGKSTVTIKKTGSRTPGSGLHALCEMVIAMDHLTDRFRDVAVRIMDSTISWLPFGLRDEAYDRLFDFSEDTKHLRLLLDAATDQAKPFLS